MILYPDNYSSQTGAASYTSTEWATMEAAGCVFLPAAGARVNSEVNHVGVWGFYWSSTASDSINAYRVRFGSSNVTPNQDVGRHIGSSVRLITESN